MHVYFSNILGRNRIRQKLCTYFLCWENHSDSLFLLKSTHYCFGTPFDISDRERGIGQGWLTPWEMAMQQEAAAQREAVVRNKQQPTRKWERSGKRQWRNKSQEAAVSMDKRQLHHRTWGGGTGRQERRGGASRWEQRTRGAWQKQQRAKRQRQQQIGNTVAMCAGRWY